MANITFTSGHFPASMCTGLVIPLLKNPGLDVDYRSVTNLPTFSKILERLALVRLKLHEPYVTCVIVTGDLFVLKCGLFTCTVQCTLF